VTEPSAPGAAAPTKADPETLVLRTAPRRVTRFRRGAIIAIAAVGSTAIAGTAWLALKPATLTLATPNDDRGQPGSKAPADALAGAPVSYADVPRLGPPLPGDLGRPILDHQGRLQEALPGDSGNADAQQAAQEAAAVRQRIAAEKKAARESGVMVQLAGTTKSASPVPVAADGGAAVPPVSATEPSLSANDPNHQQRKNALVGRTNREDDVNPHTLMAPVSAWTLQAGSVIAASLITGLNSDLPGLVTAQVTENVYDSVTGRNLLIPQGSRLIGSYDSVVAFGQRRALVVWQRIILTDGSSIRVDNVPATDASGYTGLADKVDFHTWQLLKGVALSTLLGVSSELALSGQSDLVQAIRMSMQDEVARAGNQVTQRNLGVQPTITIRSGTRVRLVVHKDLVFARAASH
jgi:type IV secretion system protein VirB10